MRTGGGTLKENLGRDKVSLIQERPSFLGKVLDKKSVLEENPCRLPSQLT